MIDNDACFLVNERRPHTSIMSGKRLSRPGWGSALATFERLIGTIFGILFQVVAIYWVFVAQYRVAVVVASTPPGAPMARTSVGMH
ncbi:hypothetical protein [Cobetia sp. Ld8]|uniref:hypothetical protein n=1 Tax=Cobetia sp. Ld8 TaxID=649154 RepID=UPI003867262C